MYALAKLAEKITVPNTNINVKFQHDVGAETFSLNRENAMVLQKFKVSCRTGSSLEKKVTDFAFSLAS